MMIAEWESSYALFTKENTLLYLLLEFYFLKHIKQKPLQK